MSTAIALSLLAVVVVPCWYFIVLAELEHRGVFRSEDDNDREAIS